LNALKRLPPSNLSGKIPFQDAPCRFQQAGEIQALGLLESLYELHGNFGGFVSPLHVCSRLKGVVARDGIEPPTPAFSGLPDNAAKWLGISGYL
jgi:hypothetical protein